MSDYIQVNFECDKEKREILIALLSEHDFEGFEEENNLLKAYVSKKSFNTGIVSKISAENNVIYDIIEIADANWNKIWESNFQPVIIKNFVAVRADFHSSIKNVSHEIIINPKMSFGTGHHETTYMMMEQMAGIDFRNNTILDFGTGTGILSILAEKLGAAKVLAIDNDDLSIENATENFTINNCSKIQLDRSSLPPSGILFDIILANLTKNIIKENFDLLAEQIKRDGVILLSGLLVTDVDDILQAAEKYSLKMNNQTRKNDWVSLRLSY